MSRREGVVTIDLLLFATRAKVSLSGLPSEVWMVDVHDRLALGNGREVHEQCERLHVDHTSCTASVMTLDT